MSTPDEQHPQAPSKSRKILIILAVIIGVVGGGGAGVFMAGPLLAGKVPAANAATPAPDSASEEEHQDDDGHGGDTVGSPVHLVENMVLNPANSGGSRFLLLSVAFAVRDASVVKAMTDRDPELRDVILRDLGARTVEELTDITLRDSIKVQLRDAVRQRFGKDTVRDIYFPQFVIQ